ncbi:MULTISPECIES: DUF885 domain-containing protein [Pseudomonadota]|jgi:uncharacterized protein (DUF885 family)|uniref:DUF885 domain-containing protein n=1 Tax=Pseudomonadota TaxID=1224 RepID=UPI00076A38B0|nr:MULTISPECIES: DUF885 domain-containing protein [Pseudomonadota]|tara:strand:+ start:44770 stop:46578 length:1809 start_codon:yes stop_codon:yes gene_type:complete
MTLRPIALALFLAASPLALTVSASAQSAPAEAAAQNAELKAFFDQVDAENLAAAPQGKAYRGIRDGDYGKWNDPSDAAEAAAFARGQKALATMKARFDPAKLSPEDRLSYRLFEYQAERSARAHPYRKNEYIFDQMNGAQSQMPAFLINIHSVKSKQDAEAYVQRLQGMGPQMDALVAESRQRSEAGVMPPKWVYPFVLDDARNVIKGAPFNEGAPSTLLADLTKKVEALDIAAPEKAALIEAGRQALTTSVKPAYQRLIAEMERQQAIAPTEDGIWRLKDGGAYYTQLLANYTTTDLSADQIHQIGLDNVARIHGEMREIMKKVGFKGSLQEFFAFVRTDDRFYFKTREDYLATVDTRLKAMQAKLPDYFATLPKAPLTVKAVEAFREKSAGKAFYQSPAPDGSRPGTYYVNLYNLKDMASTELEALAYHEGLPGHHLQRAVQTELGDLPPFRRFGGVTAYTEGWGLYSEELGKDMGFYEDPYSDFGRLGMELWRACRLVVDTGIHHKRWSREQAIQYLTDNTPNPPGDISKAIERYVVYPGQATAYMIGKLKIMELRDKAQKTLGPKFSFARFHDAVLRSGPVPLTVLEERIDAWIQAGG